MGRSRSLIAMGERSDAAVRTLPALLEARARSTPGAPFVIFDDLRGQVTARTYREFDREVNRTAHLLGRLGVRRGDTVTLLLANCLEFLALWFGAAKLGAVIVPVNTASSASELEYLVAHSESRLIFTQSARLDLARQVRTPVPAGRGGARLRDRRAVGSGRLRPAGRPLSRDAARGAGAVAHRRGGHSLYLRHHGAAEGGAGHPRQLPLRRRDGGARGAPHPEDRHLVRAAAVPRQRPVLLDDERAGGRRERGADGALQRQPLLRSGDRAPLHGLQPVRGADPDAAGPAPAAGACAQRLCAR